MSRKPGLGGCAVRSAISNQAFIRLSLLSRFKVTVMPVAEDLFRLQWTLTQGCYSTAAGPSVLVPQLCRPSLSSYLYQIVLMSLIACSNTPLPKFIYGGPPPDLSLPSERDQLAQ